MAAARDGFVRSFRDHLRDPRFWVVQVLVVSISVVHGVLEATGYLHEPPEYLLPVSTYFIPALYAALNFGVRGALPTGLWCIVLSTPNIIVNHHGVERIGEAAQVSLVCALTVIVAHHVDKERQAKLVAQAVNRRLTETQEALHAYIGMALRAQEDERLRLSHELHDDTIQQLVVVKAAIENLYDDARRSRRLRVVDAALQKSIDDIRRFCRALRPSILDDLGLAAALEALVSGLSERTTIRTSLQLPAEPARVDPESELVIFRIAQEALHNVERHSKANRAAVRLDYRPDRVCLSVEDDGAGFDVARAWTSGLGLSGMQERARLVNGALKVTSKPGRTRVAVEVPVGTATFWSDRSTAVTPPAIPQQVG